MADFQVTISNQLDIFGGAPSNKWNAYDWNDFLWGEGTADVAHAFFINLGNGLSFSTSVKFGRFFRTRETITISDSLTRTRRDGSGYAYGTIPSSTWTLDDVPLDTWTEKTEPTQSWTEKTEPTTAYAETVETTSNWS